MYKIYTLTNPINGLIFYVGKTVQDLKVRLRCHCSEIVNYKDTPSRKKVILKQILYNNQIPIIEEIACVNDAKSAEIEELFWMHQLKEWGFPISNREVNKSQYYEIHYTDEFKYGVATLKTNNMKKNCFVCNKEYDGNRKSMFCSPECKTLFKNKNSIREIEKKIDELPKPEPKPEIRAKKSVFDNIVVTEADKQRLGAMFGIDARRKSKCGF